MALARVADSVYLSPAAQCLSRCSFSYFTDLRVLIDRVSMPECAINSTGETGHLAGHPTFRRSTEVASEHHGCLSTSPSYLRVVYMTVRSVVLFGSFVPT